MGDMGISSWDDHGQISNAEISARDVSYSMMGYSLSAEVHSGKQGYP